MGEAKKIGFIGLGIMGNPMAKNLLKAGYTLTIWNRTASKMIELVRLGAKAANSPKEVAEKSEVVITMVVDSSDVEEVLLGSLGVLEGAKPGLIVIDMSSISPIVSRRLAKALAEKNVKMLDAPVSGGEIGAREATLSIMVGGPKDVYEECLPILQTLGKQITYMGDSGAGQATKLCNQIICALHIQAVCEGLMLGAKLNLDLERLLQVLNAGYASSRILSDLGPKIMNRDFRPGFKMRHQLKDLKNAMEIAGILNLPLPCTSLVYQMFRSVEAMGCGEDGTQAAILVMERLAEQKLR
jgi:3-hydroxyisobutyrate dehydrogenase